MFRQVFYISWYVVGTFTISEAYTSIYECKDTKSNFSFYVNIDNNSLHFENGDSLWVLDYNKTVNVKDKPNILVHIFKKDNIDFLVFQNKTNPIDIYLDDYKDNKLRYKYMCKLKSILKLKSKPTKDNKIPITWKIVKDCENILRKASKSVGVSKQKNETTLE